MRVTFVDINKCGGGGGGGGGGVDGVKINTGKGRRNNR